MKDYILSQLKNLLAIDSPSGMAREAAAYVADELRALGFAPTRTVKGCVACDLGGAGERVTLAAGRARGYPGRHGDGGQGQRPPAHHGRRLAQRQ